MASLADVYVSVLPDFTKLGPAVKRELPRHIPDSVGDDAGKRVGSRFGGAFLGSFKGIATGVGVALAGAGIANLFSSVISEAREAAQVTRLTENAIKVTGGAANVTAGQVGKLAEAISNKTGIDDEAVQSSANLLLTFKNVRNELGDGNAVFDRATALTQDLAAAGFGSAEGASKMLGKALNDPIAGLSALSRAGVTFTDEQKEQIKTLVETGDVLGAQRIILDEVASQVGGAAEAAADPIQRLQTTLNNLKEQMGTALLPVIQSVADWLGPKLVVGAEKLSTFFSGTLVPAVERIVEAFRSGAAEGEGQGFVGFLERVAVAAREAFDYFKSDILPRLQDFADWVMEKVVPAIRDYLIKYLEGLRGWLDNVRTAVEENRPQLEKLAEAFVNIGQWIVDNVIPALGWLAEHWFPLLGDVIGGVIDVIADIVTAVDTFIGWLETLAGRFNTVADYIRTLGTTMSVIWAGIADAVADGTRTVIDFFLGMVETIIRGAADAFGWVPGIGPKLQDAANQFAQFRDSVNASLAGVQDQEVSVTARLAKEGIDVSSFLGSTAGRLAAGGPVHGPGSGTSDTAGLFALSNNEHARAAREVAAAGGHGAVAALRKGVLGLARGGPAQFNINANTAGAESAAREAATEMANVIDAGTAAVLKQVFGSLGGGTVAGGYLAQMAVLRAAFPGLPLISGFRAGAFTSTGNLSYHAQGRAVDIPPRWDVFNWIAANYGKNTKELIFTPAGGRQIKNGSPHVFTGGTIQQDHYDHVHWARAQGGWLQPGWNPPAYNGTGKPERLTNTTDAVRWHRDDLDYLAERIIIGSVAAIQTGQDVVARRVTYGRVR